MPRQTRLLATGTALAVLFSAGAASAEPVFNRVASFPVNTNLPADVDPATETSSEIIYVTEDGMTLVYSDSPFGGIGMIDISDPANPAPGGYVKLDGEPTSLVIQSGHAFVGLNTSESYTEPSGALLSVNLETGEIEQSCDLKGQPDSVALSKDGALVAVAIENERDEDLGDGGLPQMPAGTLAIIGAADGALDCGTTKFVDMTGLADVAGEDPEPEFVDFNEAGEIALTLQENNYIAIIDAKTGEVVSHFSAGSVDLDNVDTEEEGALTFDGTLTSVPREPDAVQWLDNDRLVIANEGDWNGGSRGFTIFSKAGEVLYDSGLSFEYEVAMAGHYPEKRSGNKGAEPEGMEVGTFGDKTFIFLLSERGSVVGVYEDTGAAPEFKQILPTALAPEGAVAIPGRNLLAVANEADLIDDGGVRSHVTIYSYEEGEAQYPMLVSGMDGDVPLGWGAMSGLVADEEQAGILYGVNDSFYAMQPTIFTIDANQTPAKITAATRVTRGGAAAQLMDQEGITTDGKGGFWLASEGRTDRLIPHALYNVNAKGEIKTQVAFPPELLAVEKRFGSEGVTRIGDTLWIAIQREWADDEAGQVKLVAYNTDTKEWGAVRYPLEPKGAGWVGLSEITAHGDYVYIVERDNQIGAAAKLKKLFRVPVSELQPAALGGELPLVTKEEVHDFIPDLTSTGGYVVDKIEGFAIDAAGNGFAVTDNDGIDDSNGETLFLRLGAM
ncbi:esterase-like activity of phytase family protein [Oricola sp.]|uniref:esterase-like activity of phytase family protein n=1 Tax=Oricola sp. TaxID=1979950 RepID=UPI0025D13B17|nr:esterase-like activity of phytase family protein [Oricola sp.]MCI5074642.1 esterase-like activity of phytase family protein [Oricola sp.]